MKEGVGFFRGGIWGQKGCEVKKEMSKVLHIMRNSSKSPVESASSIRKKDLIHLSGYRTTPLFYLLLLTHT